MAANARRGRSGAPLPEPWLSTVLVGGAVIAGAPVAPTTMRAVTGAPVPPSVETMALVVLAWVPAAMPATSIPKPQLAPGASVRPAIDTRFVPAAAVMVPPQLPPMLFGVAITSPAGNVSVKPMPVSVPGSGDAGLTSTVGAVLGLVIVKVSDVVPPTGSTPHRTPW